MRWLVLVVAVGCVGTSGSPPAGGCVPVQVGCDTIEPVSCCIAPLDAPWAVVCWYDLDGARYDCDGGDCADAEEAMVCDACGCDDTGGWGFPLSDQTQRNGR